MNLVAALRVSLAARWRLRCSSSPRHREWRFFVFPERVSGQFHDTALFDVGALQCPIKRSSGMKARSAGLEINNKSGCVLART